MARRARGAAKRLLMWARVAPRSDSGCRRLAARYADRRPGSQLPRADQRLEILVRAAGRGAGGSACRNELVQVAAASLGEGFDSDVQESAAGSFVRRSAV